MREVLGWEAIDGLLEAVQDDFPLAAPALGLIRGELAAMRYVLGVPLIEAGDANPAMAETPGGRRDIGTVPKQQQSVRDALVFAPSTQHAMRAVVTDARLYGFTGNMCQDCGGVHMIRSGTCEKCTDCGSTSGCS